MEIKKRRSYDFRTEEDIKLSQEFENTGFVITKADQIPLARIKKEIEEACWSFCREKGLDHTEIKIDNIHEVIENSDSNSLRLKTMNSALYGIDINYNYYQLAKGIIHSLCGNELAMQKRPGLSINFPNNENDALPIHADTWNGVSPYELNAWLPLVDCQNTMCLYILKKETFNNIKGSLPGLLNKSSDEIFNELKPMLTWIEIKYGEVLTFDQSLPHGFITNRENRTHWSLNCRFKGLHTPYWDKKLGEYFIPITARSCTRIGLDYKHPTYWAEE